MNRKDGKPKKKLGSGVAPVPRELEPAGLRTLRDAVELQSQRAMALYREVMTAPAQPTLRRVA